MSRKVHITGAQEAGPGGVESLHGTANGTEEYLKVRKVCERFIAHLEFDG
jgi:hypothetical protein